MAEVGTVITNDLNACDGETEQEVTMKRAIVYEQYFGEADSSLVTSMFRTPEATR